MIRDSGAKAGLSLRPKTPVEDLFPYLPDLDLILVMSVEPGFGGQLFMPDMMEKIEALRSQFPGLISVDGGIDPSSAPLAVTAGADVLVAGNSIFGKKNRAQAMAQLRDSCKNLS
jgi:ribulose-phosphate 3-epimerase